jgi:hypothetical protein
MLGSAPVSLSIPSTRSTARVGRGDDRTCRLWIGTITEVDDEGRLVCQTSQIHVPVFGCCPELTGDSSSMAV